MRLYCEQNLSANNKHDVTFISQLDATDRQIRAQNSVERRKTDLSCVNLVATVLDWLLTVLSDTCRSAKYFVATKPN